MTIRLSCTVAALALVMATRLSWAHPDVDAARTAFAEGDFALVLKHLEDAERSPAATDEDRAAIHWYRAASLHALGRVGEASGSLDRLLSWRPLYQPDRAETPPRLRALFAERVAAYQAEHGVTLGPPRVEGMALAVDLAGHTEEVARVRVFLRPDPGAEFSPWDLEVAGGVARGVVGDVAFWARVAATGWLACVVEAHDVRGVPVARAGDALEPLVLVVTEENALAAARALAPPPEVTSSSAPSSAPAVAGPVSPTPAESTAATLARLLATPWKVLGLATGGVGVCCFSSGLTSLVLAFLVPFAADIPTPGSSPDPAALAALGSGSCCCVSLFSCANAGALAGCTFSLLGAEVSYRRLMATAETPAEEDLEDGDDEEDRAP
jgi:hypothetical protein